MIKCPSCGHENVDGTQFCEMCGEELAAASAQGAPAPGASATGSDAPTGMVKCPACDNLNPTDNVVCEVCGTELRPGALAGSATGAPDDVALNAGSGLASTPSATPSAAPATTPFDTSALGSLDSNALDPALGADPSTSSPAPLAHDAAVATDSDASLPTVTASSADPLADDIFAKPAPDATDFGAATVPITPAPDATPSSGGALEPGKVKLVVEQGMTVGKQFVLGDTEVLVGREDDEEGIYPDIDLSDQDEGYVHRKHATLTFANGGLSVTHLGGANKTRVNNKPLADNTPQPVNIGDKVAFGKVVMRVQSN